MTDIAIGELVQLKSGGPRMTVDDIGDYSPMGIGGEPHKAKCSWFDAKSKRVSDIFALHTLKRIDEGPAGSIRVSRA